MTIYGDLLTLVILQPSWTDESRCRDGNTIVFSKTFFSNWQVVHGCQGFIQYMMYMLLFLSADVFHPYFCNIPKTVPCWKIWLWLNMGNNGCDSNKTSWSREVWSNTAWVWAVCVVPILILPLLHYIYGQLNLFDLRLRFPIKGTIYRIYNSELKEKCSCLLWDIIVPSHGFFQPLEPFKSTILYPIRRYMHIPGQEYRQPGLPPCCHSLKSYDAGLEKIAFPLRDLCLEETRRRDSVSAWARGRMAPLMQGPIFFSDQLHIGLPTPERSLFMQNKSAKFRTNTFWCTKQPHWGCEHPTSYGSEMNLHTSRVLAYGQRTHDIENEPLYFLFSFLWLVRF